MKLLKNVAAVLVVLILFALADIDSNFNFENMIVLLLTLGQAFFIEYLVHWRWNRFHLSFDSVVKYFACGFLLTTPMALVFEAIVSTVTTIAWVLIVSLVVSTDTDLADAFATDSKKAMKKLAVEHQGVFIFYLFLNSFVVAGLVEEMVKYFGYWMVIVPDLLPQDDVSTQSSENGDANIDSEEGESRQGESSAVTNNGGNRASAKSTGIGITVAMVSVALGFACCE